eukprot:m.31833 g.31833  ORF g.31833 m.31833 type:complete len:97 (+) comp8351_c0_seq2:598-888(+)
MLLEENVHLPTSAVKPGPTPEIHLKDVPDIKTLLRGKEPAKEMVNNLVNVLFAYAYVLRRFNGEILAQDVVSGFLFFRSIYCKYYQIFSAVNTLFL